MSGDAQVYGHFNSQPREGGWVACLAARQAQRDFNSQPREGGWRVYFCCRISARDFNSQPREGGWALRTTRRNPWADFNSQPREGGWLILLMPTARRHRFQLTAARRRLAIATLEMIKGFLFQLTAARRRLVGDYNANGIRTWNFNSQPREGGWAYTLVEPLLSAISTHSRAKAAGNIHILSAKPSAYFNSQPREGGWCFFGDFLFYDSGFQLTAARRRLVDYRRGRAKVASFQLTAARRRLDTGISLIDYTKFNFNSQPREGGWKVVVPLRAILNRFQLTAARRRLVVHGLHLSAKHGISTHSRAKAAGSDVWWRRRRAGISTHSRAKAAGHKCKSKGNKFYISTHSRAKAAGTREDAFSAGVDISTHSRAKAAGFFGRRVYPEKGFQLTAARRRLETVVSAIIWHR